MVGSVKKYLKLFNLHNNFIVYFAFAFLFLPTSYAAQDDRNKESTTPFGVFCNGRSVHKDLLNRGHICFLRLGESESEYSEPNFRIFCYDAITVKMVMLVLNSS